MDAVFLIYFKLCIKQQTPDYIISISIFAFIYMNFTGKMGPNKKIGVVQVTRPTLDFYPLP